MHPSDEAAWDIDEAIWDIDEAIGDIDEAIGDMTTQNEAIGGFMQRC